MQNSTELWHWCGILIYKTSSCNSNGFTSNFCSISFTKKLALGELGLISTYLYWGDTIHKSAAWLFQFLCFLQLRKWIRQDWLQDWLHLGISRQEGTTENDSLPDLLSDTSRETWYSDTCSYRLAFRKISNVDLKASCDGKSTTCTGNFYLNWSRQAFNPKISLYYHHYIQHLPADTEL